MAGQPEPLPTLSRYVSHASVLTTRSIAPGVDRVEELRRLGAWVSWWGGPSADTGLPWPRRNDGTPLAHVASVHLADADSVFGTRDGRDPTQGMTDLTLPATGLLEVFHDLHTTGTSTQDGNTGAWCVRWVEEDLPGSLMPPPTGTPQPEGCTGLTAMAGYTVPAPSDPPYVDSEPLTAELDAAWWPGPHGPPLARSYLYGHSRKGMAPVADLLNRVRPCLRTPSHRLVASLSLPVPWTGWWYDGATLEVWASGDDVDTQRLDRAWCLLR